MMTLIPGIGYKIEGDTVHPEQSSGCGETVWIDLHRIHLHHIAEQMGAVIGPDKRDAAIAGLCKRMRYLRERIEDLRHLIEGIPSFPPGSGPSEDEIKIAELDDLAALFCDELPDASREAGGSQANSGPKSLDRAEGVDGHRHAPDDALECAHV